MAVEFRDFSIEVKNIIDDTAVAFLYEAAGELEAQVKRNVPNHGRWFTEQKNEWTYKVDESKLEAVVGNPLERAIWTEYGTGEESESPKGGRQGYWIYVKGSGLDDMGGYTYKGGQSYTREEAKKIVAMMRADGLDARYTKGQQAHRPFQKAYNKMKPKIKKMAAERFKDMK